MKTKIKAKKRSIFLRMLIGFFKLIWLLLKLVFRAIKFLFSKIKTKKEKIKQTKAEKSRPKYPAKYDKFTVLKTISGDFSKFENKLLHNQSLIGIILGARGTGKSAIGMRLLENLHSKIKRNICAMGFKKENLPSWINIVDTIENIPNNSFVLIDEAGIEFSSRDSMSNPNKLLSKLLLIARHKDLSVLFISQNSSNIEINIIRQADFLILKPSSLLQRDFERGKIKEIYDEVHADFNKYKDEEGLAYIYSNEFTGFVKNRLPGFWNRDVSKSYR
jgi:hypothetical protein